MEWKAGKITAYQIRSAEPREVMVRVNGETKFMKSQEQSCNIEPFGGGCTLRKE